MDTRFGRFTFLIIPSHHSHLKAPPGPCISAWLGTQSLLVAPMSNSRCQMGPPKAGQISANLAPRRIRAGVSRRQFLRGTGILLSLPLLEAMRPPLSALAE